MKHLLMVGLLLLPPAMADSITLWKGASVEDVTIVDIRDGLVYFTYSDGRKGRAKLIDIRAIGREWGQPAEMAIPEAESTPRPESRSISGEARVAKFAAFKGNRYSGYELQIRVRTDASQIPAPLVRLFALSEDEKGEREFRCYMNYKVDDPTVTHRLPKVNASAFADRRYLIELDTLVSWRAEVWINGELSAMKEQPGEEEADWWRRQRPQRTSTMRDMPEAEFPQPEEAGAFDPVGPPPTVQCQIGFARLSRKIEDETLYFSFGYTLREEGDTAELPKVVFYALVEDPDGNRKVRSFPGEERAGDILALTASHLNRQGRIELPTNIAMANNRSAGVDRIIYWRLEASYNNHIVAAKESSDIRIKRQLEPRWWQE
jgi:hypothetical protein